MNARLDLYQFVNRLVYSELPAPKHGDTTPTDALDDEAINKEDDYEFLRFEIAFPEVSGAYNQLNSAAKDRLPKDAQQAEPEDRAWGMIQRGVENDVLKYGSRVWCPTQAMKEKVSRYSQISHHLQWKRSTNGGESRRMVSEADYIFFHQVDYLTGSKQIPDTDRANIPTPPNINDPIEKVNRFADSVVKTGRPDPNLRPNLLLLSADELVAEVARKTGVNKLIEGLRQMVFSPSSTNSEPDNTFEERVDVQKTRTDDLYDYLVTKKCLAEEHRAFLQLSGFKSSPKKDVIFNLYLSCWSRDKSNQPEEADKWHKTIITLEASKPEGLAPDQTIDVCAKIPLYRKRCSPFRLSFSQDQSWLPSNQPARVLSPSEESKKYVNLNTMLQNKDLQTSNPNNMLKKFRLALQLALSLHQLYAGPWIQHEWSSNCLQILQNPESNPLEMLNEIYVSCNFTKDWKEQIMFPERSEGYCDREICPRFFLSLAQLLLEIAKGERDDKFSHEAEPSMWYKMLVQEVNMKFFQDKPMESYRKAIEGCLLYLENYSSEKQQIQDEKLRAQSVILHNIVFHLQRSLDLWESQRYKLQGTHDTEFIEELKQLPGPAKNKGIARQIREESTARAEEEGRPTVEPEFTLWYVEDNKHSERIEKKTIDPSMSENSFTTRMEKFSKTYIERLPEPTDQGGTGKRVRVAVIDSGFHQDESDFELLRFEDEKRIEVKRNFYIPVPQNPKSETPIQGDADPDDWKDIHGHGTHVARLILRFAPRAEVVVAKIINSRSLKKTRTRQLLEALKWAGENADIINLSFGLGSMPELDLAEEIKRLVIKERKLIFAAASNTGGYGARSWPATEPGVFCIHATDELGSRVPGMNPEPLAKQDNFAVLGHEIESYWDGEDRSISGTSFATPIAAAIAANVLEFATRRAPETAELLSVYGIMRNLFREHMTDNSESSLYHNIKAWTGGLWDGRNSDEKICEKLGEVAVFVNQQKN